VAKTVEEEQIVFKDLKHQREQLVLEIARVSKDLEKARSVVLCEVDAFARARTLSLKLAELAKERDVLALQIEQGIPLQPQAQAP
jgi:hypothetical protein